MQRWSERGCSRKLRRIQRMQVRLLGGFGDSSSNIVRQPVKGIGEFPRPRMLDPAMSKVCGLRTYGPNTWRREGNSAAGVGYWPQG